MKNGDRTRCDSTRSLRTTPAPRCVSRTRPAMYDGAVFEPLLSGLVGGGAGVRGVNAAGLRPSSVPVTRLPGVL